MEFFDAHCHLEHAQFALDLPAVIQRAKSANTTCVSHGTGADSNARTLELASASPKTVLVALGQDPFHAAEDLDAHIQLMETNRKHLVAVGEIGLDQHYFTPEHLPRQKQVFETQLAFAERHGLPVVIHTRKAVDAVLDILPSFLCTKVLHFFLEKKHAARALEKGCYLSLPTVQSKDRTAIIKMAPIDQLLCETDSPYGWKSGPGAPTSADGNPARNEPSNVREVYEHIAKTLNKDLKDVQGQINQNANKVFQHGKTH